MLLPLYSAKGKRLHSFRESDLACHVDINWSLGMQNPNGTQSARHGQEAFRAIPINVRRKCTRFINSFIQKLKVCSRCLYFSMSLPYPHTRVFPMSFIVCPTIFLSDRTKLSSQKFVLPPAISSYLNARLYQNPHNSLIEQQRF